jgi:hypothetical protein
MLRSARTSASDYVIIAPRHWHHLLSNGACDRLATMHLTLPEDTWAHIDHDRMYPDKRIFSGQLPPRGIWLASWLRQFVRSHHDLPIFWPDWPWIRENGEYYAFNRSDPRPERPMVRRQTSLAPHAVQLLQARGAADGAPYATILRRLLVQHFGRRPTHPVRITGGRHRITPGQGPDCPSCGV